MVAKYPPLEASFAELADLSEEPRGRLASTDFFVVPTATFRLLFVFVVLSHNRRRLVHFGVTTHPTAEWTAQQLMAAFPWDSAPRYLLRDRDGNYGEPFSRQPTGWVFTRY